MERNLTNIKERILYYTDIQKLSKEKFFEDLQTTYGNFKGKAKQQALNSDIIERIITNHPDINPEWLLTGKGEMLKFKYSNITLMPAIKLEEIQGLTDVALYDVQLLEEKLKKANKRIELLEELVESYKLEINDLKNELSKFTKGKTIRK